MTATTSTRRELLTVAAGVAGGAAASGVAAQEDGEGDGEEGDGDGEDGGGGGGEERVDMNDALVFDPDQLTVAPGTTVVWETVESVPHTVTAYEEDIPEDAEYFASGGFDSESAARASSSAGLVEEGETYSHTFEVEGTYEYFCIPHESAGMLGTIEVGGDGGEGALRPTLPDRALTLGVVAVSVLLATVALAYVFIKYGGDYGVE